MRVHAAWVELNRPSELSLGAGPVPIVNVLRNSQRSACFGQGAVNLQGLQCRRLGFGKRVFRLKIGKYAQRPVAVRQSGVGQGVPWILFDRLLKIIHAFL